MTDKPENPPAFPVGHNDMCNGMTLRDWFAGQALVGLLASTMNSDNAVFARSAYRFADVMLLERSKP